jgi:6-phosphogluconolactonase
VPLALEVPGDSSALARAGADYVARTLTDAVRNRGAATWALSGGATPWTMIADLAHRPVPWENVTIYQVDERAAPDGDPSRNLTHLRVSLGNAPAHVIAMDVTAPDLESAADAYGAQLPARLDLLHLGLGADGHTASLVPGDPVLLVTDRLVAVTEPYQGHRRMTLTYPALARADATLWLVAGADKQTALAQLLAGDPTVPAGRVATENAVVMADVAAHP